MGRLRMDHRPWRRQGAVDGMAAAFEVFVHGVLKQIMGAVDDESAPTLG